MNRFSAKITLVALFGLSACGGGVLEDGEMRVTSSDGATFSGVAGNAWTEDEIRDNAGRNSCGGNLPTSFTVTKTDQGQAFEGSC